MRREDLVALVQPVLQEEGYELVECSVSRTPRSQTFRVAIDRAEGVPVEACARISRRISMLLEANPVLRGAYQLEVSSAGMNRRIWSTEHFRRFRGEKVHIELLGTDGKALRGVIAGVEGESVLFRAESGDERLVPLDRIARAQIHLDPWKKRRTEGTATEEPAPETEVPGGGPKAGRVTRSKPEAGSGRRARTRGRNA